MKTRFWKRQSISCAMLVWLATCASVPTAPARGVISITDHSTEGGQKFSLAFMPDAGKVSLQVIWPNNYAHTSAKPVASGLGTELMSSGGAAARSAREIKQDMVALGSGASLVATPDHIYGTFTSVPETLSETLEIVQDVITSPSFDQLRFGVSQEAKLKRVEAQQAQPSSVLWSAARRTLIGESTLTDYWNSTPVTPIVTSLTLGDVERWHKETFTRQNVTIAVAGSIEADEAAVMIDKLLEDLPVTPTDAAPVRLTHTLNRGMTVLLHDESMPVTLIAAVGLLPPSREGGEVADVIAVSALGKGKDSRLVKASVAELGETDKVDASVANFSRAVRVFGINASVDNKTAAEAYELFEQTYADFKLGNLEDQDVLRAAVPFANSLQGNQDNPDLLAYGLGQLLLDQLPPERLLTVMQDAISLKADDINQRIIDSYPQWDDLVKVVLSSDAKIIDADCVVSSVEEISQCQ